MERLINLEAIRLQHKRNSSLAHIRSIANIRIHALITNQYYYNNVQTYLLLMVIDELIHDITEPRRLPM